MVVVPPIRLKGYRRIYLNKRMTYGHLEDADQLLGRCSFQDQEEFYQHYKDSF